MATLLSIASYSEGSCYYLSHWRGEAHRKIQARIQIGEDHKYIASFKSSLIELLGLNDLATKFGLASFDLVSSAAVFLVFVKPMTSLVFVGINSPRINYINDII